MGSHVNAKGWAGGGVNSQPIANPATGTVTTGWREYNTMDLNGNPLDMSGREFVYQLNAGEVAGYCSRAQVFSAYNSGAGWDPMPEDTSDCIDVDGTGGASSSSSAASSEASSESSIASSSSSNSEASSEASSESSSSVSSESGGGTSESSSSSSTGLSINWSPTYEDFAAVVAAQPAAGSNANFNANASAFAIGNFNFYSSGAGSLRLHLTADSSAYAINYNGSSLRTEPTKFVEGSSGQVNPTQLTGAGGVSRYVSYPVVSSSDALTFTVTYTNGSADYDVVNNQNGCLNGQIAIVDQTGKAWKVASSCGNTTPSTITATISDPNVTELYVLMSRNGDGGGGIRIWNIQVTR